MWSRVMWGGFIYEDDIIFGMRNNESVYHLYHKVRVFNVDDVGYMIYDKWVRVFLNTGSLSGGEKPL